MALDGDAPEGFQMIQWKPKKRQCKSEGCRRRFLAEKEHVWWCSPECGAKLALAKLAKARAKKAGKERKETRAKKESMKGRRDLTAEVQKAFNAYVRERDHGKPCISCGRSEETIRKQDVGGTWDCGHYRSVGACPELRFESLNAHRQCKKCNSRKSGNVVEYRIRLIKRIGQESVDWLEGPHEPKKYTVEDLRALKAYFNEQARRIRKEREQRGMVGCGYQKQDSATEAQHE